MTNLLESLTRNLTVARPLWLILLPVLIVPLILFSYKSLAGLGKVRRIFAILIRTAVVSAIVLALAEVSTVQRNEKLTTMYVIDTSESIPQEYRGAILSFVSEDSKQRNKTKDDLTGAIIFGKGPSVEAPPAPTEVSVNMGVENTVDREYTDLGGAIKLALATFPEDTARRIVLISDGNENRGNALEQALAAKDLKVQIDVLPVDYFYDKEVLVEKVSLPPDVKKGETVNINVVVRASEPTKGTLQIFQKDSDNRSVPAPGNEKPVPVELRRGVNVFTLKQLITEPSFYTFTAEFIPEKGSGDRRAINNVATGFTYARGTAQVLLIEGVKNEHAELVKALKEKKLEVKVLTAPGVGGGGNEGGDTLPDDIGQLQPFDTIILGNVPKDSFTEAQQRLLESNVHDMGAGLIMLGGENSFGAGGWMNTPVEKALPVDMQIKAMKVQGKGALVQIMHATEIPEGNYWMKVIAQEAIKTLSSYDYCGMVHWEGQEAWLFTIRPVGNGKEIAPNTPVVGLPGAPQPGIVNNDPVVLNPSVPLTPGQSGSMLQRQAMRAFEAGERLLSQGMTGGSDRAFQQAAERYANTLRAIASQPVIRITPPATGTTVNTPIGSVTVATTPATTRPAETIGADPASVALINHAVKEALGAMKIRRMIRAENGSSGPSGQQLMEHAQMMESESRSTIRAFAGIGDAGPVARAAGELGSPNGTVQALAEQANQLITAIQGAVAPEPVNLGR